jgi:hypothetical protein
MLEKISDVLSVALDYGWKRSRADKTSAVKVRQLDWGHRGTAAAAVDKGHQASRQRRA